MTCSQHGLQCGLMRFDEGDVGGARIVGRLDIGEQQPELTDEQATVRSRMMGLLGLLCPIGPRPHALDHAQIRARLGRAFTRRVSTCQLR